jgi:divalent metal cation (Fe/Co/Zn/Cd) transporter
LVDADRQRETLIRQAFWLEWLTVAWMAVEAVVAVASGLTANSISLLAFGLDSVVELASAGVLIWRLSNELRFGREVSSRVELIAGRITGGLLFALAAYVLGAAGWSLGHGEGPAFSWSGLVAAFLAMPIMFGLARCASSSWPGNLAAERCARMPPSRRLASGCPLSSCSASPPSSPLEPGGSTR